MVLSNRDIMAAIAAGHILIHPAPPQCNYGTSSLDLRVGREFWKWRPEAQGVQLRINCSEARVPELRRYARQVDAGADGLIEVPSRGFLLGRTLEVIRLPPHARLAARVEGRSSLARLGLGVHITAPTIHAGFSGPIVLEFMNHGPHALLLEPGKTCVCQMIFEQLASEPTIQISTVFQDQDGPFGSRQ